MQQIEKLENIQFNGGLELTIGNFDGVHRGHQDLLNKIKKDCESNNNKFVVVSFVPHPKLIISPSNNFLINLYDERKDLLESCNIDYLYEIPFNRDFSTLSPEQFLDQYILLDKRVKKLYIGHDFAFGANKAGDYNFISQYCLNKKIDVELGDKFLLNNLLVSSSAIREALRAGLITKANQMLGRPFYMKGRVIKGKGRGKTIGFPTANIQYVRERIVPQHGVYSSITEWKKGKFLSITNVGRNPTFDDVEDVCVETHILDFDEDIYGEELKVNFLERMRDEKKFNNVHELVDQIKLDVEKRKQIP